MDEPALLELAREAVCRWPLHATRIELAARRENLVFRVATEAGQNFALRIHRPGYRSSAELISELAWMDALGHGGLMVPTPLKSLAGHFLEEVDGRRISVLSWLSGVPLGRSGTPLCIENRESVFHALGQTLARLHAISDAWKSPPGFIRPRWDIAGLLGPEPLWGAFWENPLLDEHQRHTLGLARTVAREELERLGPSLDRGLIHADCVRENVLLDHGRIQLIDFDDSAFGFRLFDVATALLKNRMEAGYPALEAALCDGYRSLRPLDVGHLELFLMLRALTYVGWIVSRIGEPGGSERNTRFVATGIDLAETYLRSR